MARYRVQVERIGDGREITVTVSYPVRHRGRRLIDYRQFTARRGMRAYDILVEAARLAEERARAESRWQSRVFGGKIEYAEYEVDTDTALRVARMIDEAVKAYMEERMGEAMELWG